WRFIANYESTLLVRVYPRGKLAFDRQPAFDDYEVEQPVDCCEEHLIYWSISSACEQARIPSDGCKKTLNIVSAVEVQESGESVSDHCGVAGEGYVSLGRECNGDLSPTPLRQLGCSLVPACSPRWSAELEKKFSDDFPPEEA